MFQAMLVAGDQDGAVSETQLRACGVTARHQRDAVRSNQLAVADTGVLVVFGSPDTWFRRLRIGLLVVGPDAWVSHESAAELLGLEGATSGLVVLTCLRSRRGRLVRGGVVHTTALVGPHDLLWVKGFRCTSATRTILDLAATGLHESSVSKLIDSAMHRRLSAPLVLERRLAEIRGPGRYGVRLLDQLLLDTGGESVLERRFLRLIREHGLPRPQTQRRIGRVDGRVARVDFLYVEERLVVEVSGRLGHATDAERTNDAQRRNELQDLGYFVCEYTWGDITRRPGYVVNSLRERIAARRIACVG